MLQTLLSRHYLLLANYLTSVQQLLPATVMRLPGKLHAALCNCKISLGSNTGAYMNRWLTVYQ
jgi:hypothetical protein